MKKILLLCFCLASIHTWAAKERPEVVSDSWTYGSMYQWRAHFAYSNIEQVTRLGEKIFAVSNNALFSVNKSTEEIEYYNRLTGLNAATIDHIAHNELLNKLLITYRNGQLDVLDTRERIYNISDLYLKLVEALSKARCNTVPSITPTQSIICLLSCL